VAVGLGDAAGVTSVTAVNLAADTGTVVIGVAAGSGGVRGVVGVEAGSGDVAAVAGRSRGALHARNAARVTSATASEEMTGSLGRGLFIDGVFTIGDHGSHQSRA
jgi:hypothetical protein